MNLVKEVPENDIVERKANMRNSVRVLQKQLPVTVQTGRSEFEMKTHSVVDFVQPLIFQSPSCHWACSKD